MTGCGDEAKVNCTLGAMRIREREHVDWDRHVTIATGPGRNVINWFMMRDSATILTSHFREWFDREMWEAYAPGVDRKNISITAWAKRSWWRDNIFTKSLAVHGYKNHWAVNAKSADKAAAKADRDAGRLPVAQVESDREEALGAKSAWLALAIERLESLPFFGVFENMSATSELVAFHLCIPRRADPSHGKNDAAARGKTSAGLVCDARCADRRADEASMRKFVLKRHGLDLRLYAHAQKVRACGRRVECLSRSYLGSLRALAGVRRAVRADAPPQAGGAGVPPPSGRLCLGPPPAGVRAGVRRQPRVDRLALSGGARGEGGRAQAAGRAEVHPVDGRAALVWARRQGARRGGAGCHGTNALGWAI